MIFAAVGLVIIVLSFLALSFIGSTKNKELRDDILKELKDCDRLTSGSDSDKRDCIIRLDTLLGKSMQYYGVAGSTVGEKLKNSKDVFSRDIYEGLWKAHKIRNKVVHENYSMSGKEFKSSVKYLKSGIRRLLK